MADAPIYGSKKTRAKIEAATLAVRFPELDKRAPLVASSGPNVSPWGDYGRAKKMFMVTDLDEALLWLQALDSVEPVEAERRLRKRIKETEKASADALKVRLTVAGGALRAVAAQETVRCLARALRPTALRSYHRE